MYLVGDGFRVSFKWVVIFSTKQKAGHTQSAKSQHMLHTLALWGLVTYYGEGGLQNGRGGGGQVNFTPTKRGAEKV